jgi:flagellar assembly factor FliW
METEFAGMDIQSTRFGMMSVDDDRIITFPHGLLGFPEHKQFALIQTGEENYFFWLQSVDEPNLAFVVADPTIFFKGYAVPLREETRQDIQLGEEDGAEAAVQMFVICNKVGEWLTGNLLGPLVVNAQNRLAQQVVLTEKKWTTRQPLIRLEADLELAKSA